MVTQRGRLPGPEWSLRTKAPPTGQGRWWWRSTEAETRRLTFSCNIWQGRRRLRHASERSVRTWAMCPAWSLGSGNSRKARPRNHSKQSTSETPPRSRTYDGCKEETKIGRRALTDGARMTQGSRISATCGRSDYSLLGLAG